MKKYLQRFRIEPHVILTNPIALKTIKVNELLNLDNHPLLKKTNE